MKRYPRLVVHEKTGFRNITGNPVVILDERGKVFYDTRTLDHIVWEFNLPKGTYYIERGKFSQMVHPVAYDLMPLPKPERNRRAQPEHFELIFAENPHKAIIDWKDRKIIFDDKLRDLPLPSLVMILFHEYGHKYYETENYCDRYAYNEMMKAGYNPSQAGEGFLKTLSDRQFNRKADLVENMFSRSDRYDYYDFSINDSEEHFDLPPSLAGWKDKILRVKNDIQVVARPPGEVFPLVNKDGIIKGGTTIGQIIDFKIVPTDKNPNEAWIKVSRIFPNWTIFNSKNLEQIGTTKSWDDLSEAEKDAVISNLVDAAPIIAQPAAQTASVAIDVAQWIEKNKMWIAGGFALLLLLLVFIAAKK